MGFYSSKKIAKEEWNDFCCKVERVNVSLDTEVNEKKEEEEEEEEIKPTPSLYHHVYVSAKTGEVIKVIKKSSWPKTLLEEPEYFEAHAKGNYEDVVTEARKKRDEYYKKAKDTWKIVVDLKNKKLGEGNYIGKVQMWDYYYLKKLGNIVEVYSTISPEYTMELAEEVIKRYKKGGII